MTKFENTTESRKEKHLSYDERLVITCLKNEKELPNRAIAKELERTPQTIHSEIKEGLVTMSKGFLSNKHIKHFYYFNPCQHITLFNSFNISAYIIY